MPSPESSSRENASSAAKSRLRLSIGRRPSDLVQLLLAGGVLTLSVLLSLVPANPVELVISQQLGRIPRVSESVWVVLTWFGSWAGIAVVTVVALYLKWVRVGLLCAAAGGVTWGLATVMHSILGPRLVPTPAGPAAAVSAFPSLEVAVIAVLVLIATPYLGRPARYVGWTLTVLVAAADVYLGRSLPLDAAGGALLGWGVGTLFHLLLGVPGRKVSAQIVRRELTSAGFAPVSVVAVHYRLLEPREFAVYTEDAGTLRVKAIRRMERRAGSWYKIKRLLALLDVEDEPRLSTPHHEVEHEAYVALLAERAGVRTPPVILACDAKHSPPLLVFREIEGRRISELSHEDIDDELLEAIWAQVAALARAGIVHHDLRAENFLIDADRRPWLLSFTFSHAGADAPTRAHDLAEALVSLAAVVGSDRTVETASRALPDDQLRAALGSLLPLALPRRILKQAESGRYLLAELRETLADRLQCPIPSFRSPVRPTSVVGLLLVGAAIYLLLPELASMREVLDALRNAHWGWLAAAVGAGFLAVLMSAISILGSSRVQLPFWRTLGVQVAASFTGRTTPGGAGFFGINVVFLERLGLRRRLAVGITLLNQAAVGAVAFVVSVAGVFAVGMAGTFRLPAIPTGWPVVVSAIGVVVLAGIFLGSPFGRRRIVQPSVEVSRELFETLRHPLRAFQLFGGSLGYLVLSGFGLAACLASFYPHAPILVVIIVFVIGHTLGHLAPSPGGLGAVEAVLLAGLGTVGIPANASVTAVLVSRLLTYWLPVLPGVAMFRYLQHREVI